MVQERSAPTDVGADSVGKGKGLGVYVKAHVDALTAAVWDTEADFSCLELLKDQQITLGPWKVSVWVIGASNLFVVHHTAQFAGAFVLACGDGVQRVHTNPCATVGFAALKRGGRYNVLAGQRVRLEMDFEVRPLRVGARTTVNSSWHSSANRVALAVGFPVDTDREIEVIKDPHVYTDPRRPATVVTGFVHDYPDEIVFVGGSRHEYTDDGVVVVTRDRFRVQAPAPVSVATALN